MTSPVKFTKLELLMIKDALELISEQTKSSRLFRSTFLSANEKVSQRLANMKVSADRLDKMREEKK